MITIHHTTAYYLGTLIKNQDDIQDDFNTIVIRDFQDVNLEHWEVLKLLQTYENVIIFFTVGNITRTEIKRKYNFDDYNRLLKTDIHFINHQGFFNSGVNEKDIYFQNEVIAKFDKVKFVSDNFAVFEELALSFENIGAGDTKFIKKEPYTVDNIFGKTKHIRFSFSRSLLSHLLTTAGGKAKFIGKLLGKDRTTILYACEVVDTFIQNYATKEQVDKITGLYKNINELIQQQTICK